MARKNSFPIRYESFPNQEPRTAAQLVVRGTTDTFADGELERMRAELVKLRNSVATLTELLYLKGKIGRADVYKIADEQPEIGG